jgi:hypothetical protein
VEDEIAAVMSAVRAFLVAEDQAESSVAPPRWTRRGRLEAQGIAPSERSLRRGWSVE